MNDDELWAAIDTQRLRTADLLDSLSDTEWRTPSLCDGWTVRDVAAHLTLQQMTIGDALRWLLRFPGGMNRLIRESSRATAATPTTELVARIRGMVGSRRHNVGVTPHETLIDIVVHGQDIAVPLARELAVEPAVAAEAASRVWSLLGTSKGAVFDTVTVEGLRFTASDVDWTVGEGDEVRGPIVAILLVLTGRRAGLAALAGSGVERVARA